MSRHVISIACEAATALITAFILFLGLMFAASRMWAPAAAYALVAGVSFAFQARRLPTKTPVSDVDRLLAKAFPSGAPYGEPDACWGCGLEADEPMITTFRHPVFGLRPNLCRYCRELRELGAQRV